MVQRFFYAWQSERPRSVCRHFIRRALEAIAPVLNQTGVDERVEIDSDTQGVPGVPEILNIVLRKIDEDDVFVADLTMCSETSEPEKSRMSPNANVMFEYGYALKAKGRDRIICVMNAFYGGNDPVDLPFDLRHARAPIRYSLAPDASSAEKQKVLDKLSTELLTAATLIIDNLPSTKADLPHINFQKPHFAEGQELTPEGDFTFQSESTFFDDCTGYVYLRAHPLKLINLSVAQIKALEIGAAGLTISTGSSSGSLGSNKWGRISYALRKDGDKRLSRDYVQYFRTGDIEIVNGSYLTVVKRNGGSALHADYLVTQVVNPMLDIARQCFERLGVTDFIVEVGLLGIEGWRLAVSNFGTGPMIHIDKVFVQKKVGKDSTALLGQEFRSALLAEAGISA
jgi:hypothetical protein